MSVHTDLCTVLPVLTLRNRALVKKTMSVVKRLNDEDLGSLLYILHAIGLD